MKLSLKQGLLCVAALSATAWQLAISAPAPGVDHAQMPQIIDDLPADYAADLTAEQRTLVDRGRYIARLGDCVACHTGNKSQPMGGGLALETPFGKIYSTNISPDADTGMGKYSFEQFDRAMRKGVAADGRNLYPAMPYPSYAKMTAEDMQALYAYLLQGVAPVKAANKESDLGFPFNQRWGLALWNWVFLDDTPFQPQPQQTAQWNRGAYLVQGLGHCSACHSSRTTLGGSEEGLSGGLIPVLGWYAPSLTSNAEAGLGDWDTEHIVALLHTGVSPRATVFGPMAEVVRQSLQHLEVADVRAMAVYLKSLPDTPPPVKAAPRDTSEAATRQLAQGAKLYDTHCASCHQADGKGVPPGYPPLAGNRAILTDSPVNAIRIVLNGGFAPGTAGNPRPYGMPPYGPLLNDGEVAAVVSHLRASWGNNAPAVTALEVNKYRSVPLE